MNANQPSRTALVVAAGLQLRGEQAGFPLSALCLGAQRLQQAHPRISALLRHHWFRHACLLLERATLRGICLHFALRKRILRRHARAALAAGCSQVVVLGAGLDTLCQELAATHPGLMCFEIDHPAMLPLRPRDAAEDRIAFLPADLARQDLSQLLSAHPRFRSSAPTLFVAEGLLMYLPLEAVRTLFGRIAAAAPRSQVAFTWFDRRADGRAGFLAHSRLVDWWLRARGEPFKSSMARSELPGFLSASGFTLQSVETTRGLWHGVPGVGQPIDGEYVALAAAG